MRRALIITYYWPPSGGSGVQRWMYFAKYLKEFGIEPIVVTVDEKKASYRFIDLTFVDKVKDIEVFKTNTWEPLRLYSKIVSGDEQSAIPIGFSGESKPSLFQVLSRAIRGNLFIPDSRKGWVRFAYKRTKKIIAEKKVDLVITTGPPHSSHLVGLKLKKRFNISWIADFRDPWTDLYYNKLLFRFGFAKKKDLSLERKVLNTADMVLTVGPSMKEHLIRKGNINPEKVYFIYNGYDEGDYKNVNVSADPNYFTISHIGVLSPSQPVNAVLTAIKHFIDIKHPICQHLRLRIVGNVTDDIINEIKSAVPEITLEFIGYVPKKEAIEYMLSSDLLFNSIAEMENSELLISGKLMEYIAANKPIICLGNPNGDAANLLKEFEDSRVFDRKQIPQIIEYLDKLFYYWANKQLSTVKSDKYQMYSRYETTRQLAELINEKL